MEYPLSITSLVNVPREGERRTPLACVMVKADPGPFANFGSPESFFGKIIEVSENMIQYFTNVPGVEVLFRGASYSFEALTPTGSFKLVRRI